MTALATPVAEEREIYLSSFREFEKARAPVDPGWLASLRQASIARFAEEGFPTTRQEEWRFTSVAPIARTSFRRADGEARSVPAPEALEKLALHGASTLVFLDGRHAPDLSSARVPEGVRVESLRDVLARDPGHLERHLGRVTGEGANVFAVLNMAFFDDGALVEIAPGAVVVQPIHLIFLSTSKAAPGDARPTVSYPRTLVLAGRGSQASLVETYAGPEGECYFTSAVTEIAVGEGAVLDHCKLQREGEGAFHVYSLAVRQERDSRFSDHALSLGASLARNDIDVVFGAEGGECALDGLFMARGQQHTDTHTRIDHAAPHCASRELYKGILDGRSRGVFHGTILVRKGAQKTDALQVNKNLLVSREALVHSTPALQILADDVKCKHGSTTGQLDAGALFYLRSRGLAEEAARGLLIHAFASDVVGRIRVPEVRARLAGILSDRLPGAPEEAPA